MQTMNLQDTSSMGRCVTGQPIVCTPVAAPWIGLKWLPLLLLILMEASLPAQPYSIDWHSMDGGGGHSSGGAYSVSGTIGQMDAGRHEGAGLRVEGGFWSAFGAVQTPGSPLLTIVRIGSQVEISWPVVPGVTFQLQRSVSLSGTVPWNPEPILPSEENGLNVVRLPVQAGFHFFRLIHTVD